MTDATGFVARELELVLITVNVHLAFEFDTHALVLLCHGIPAFFGIVDARACSFRVAISCEVKGRGGGVKFRAKGEELSEGKHE